MSEGPWGSPPGPPSHLDPTGDGAGFWAYIDLPNPNVFCRWTGSAPPNSGLEEKSDKSEQKDKKEDEEKNKRIMNNEKKKEDAE